MIESRLAGKYGTALFRTAKRVDQVERISHDLEVISELLRKNLSLKNFLESPQILEKEKKELISTTLKNRVSEALFSFLMLVVSKHRIQYLLPMASEFGRLVKEDQGIVEARVIAARIIDQKLVEEIRGELEKSTDKKVEIKMEIDPDLIGGIVIILGDKIIDRSIRYQLNQLKEQMSTVRVY
jgi:F-type H+-transporting ATPase subunit delta